MDFNDNWQCNINDCQIYLEHHGIKGQKHGVRRGPPYPLKDGAKNVGSTKVKKKVPSNSDRASREARAAKKAAKAKERSERKAKETKAKAEKKAIRDKQIEEIKKARAEKKRRDILNDPSRLYKHRREYSKEEIDNALKQFDWEQKLREASKKRLENGSNFIQTLFNYTNNAVNLYNRAVSIVRTFDDDVKLPAIRPVSDYYNKLKDDKNKNDKK